MCVLGWAGGVPFRPIFMEKTQKNEVFCQGLRMGRVASCRLILMNLSYKTQCKIREKEEEEEMITMSSAKERELR